MKKRLGLVLLCISILTLLLAHTQPVERFLFSKIQSTCAKFGYQLDAKRFDINLFNLSATLQELQVQSPTLEAQLQRCLVNISSGMLFGNISLDRVAASDGFVSIKPSNEQQPKEQTGPIQIPEIWLGDAQLERIEVHYQDRSQSLNLSVEDIAVAYANSQFQLKFGLPAFQVQQRHLPKMAASLELYTEDFQSFRDVTFQLNSEDSTFEVEGAMLPELQPKFQWKALVGRDLLPEHPGTHITGSIDSKEITLTSFNQLNIEETPKRWQLETTFNYRETPTQIPLQIQLEDLAAAAIQINIDQQQYHGSFELNGELETLQMLPSQLGLKTLGLNGSFQAPKTDPAQMVATAEATIEGATEARFTFNYASGVLHLNGLAKEPSGASVSVEGQYQEQLALSIQADADNLAFLEPYTSLPPDLSLQALGITAQLETNFKSWSLQSSQMRLEKLRYGNYFDDTLIFQASGPAQQLTGSLQAESLNATAPLFVFQLDALEKVWHDIALNIESKPFELDAYRFKLSLEAAGSGPLLTPQLTGKLNSTIFEANRKTGSLASNLSFKEGQLSAQDLRLDTHHGILKGLASWHSRTNDWFVDFNLNATTQTTLAPLISQPLPEFSLHLKGTQDNLKGELDLPEQAITWGSFQLPLKAGEDLQFQGQPDQQTGNGQLKTLTIAGLDIQNLQLQIVEGQLTAAAGLDLRDSKPLQDLLAEHWPSDLQLDHFKGQFSFTSDLNFKQPQATLLIDQVTGSFRQESFSTQKASLAWTPQALSLEPFTVEFAGTRLKVSNPLPQASNAQALPIDLVLDLDIPASEQLEKLAGAQWPSGLLLDQAQAQLHLSSDWQFTQPEFNFQVTKLDASYNDQLISTQTLRGSFKNQEVHLEPGEIQVGDLLVAITNQTSGFELRAQPDMAFLSQWVPQLVGDASFNFVAIWDPARKGFEASLKQHDGRLIYPEPWMEVKDLDIALIQESNKRFTVQKGTASVNDRPLNFQTDIDLSGEHPDITVLGDVENLQLAFADYQFSLTSVVEWRYTDKINQLTGTMAVRNGYFSPKIEVEGLVQELLSPIPAIAFPDPMLEQVKLQLTVLTETPMVVEHDLGYWELETPALIIGGDLAKPVPISGSLNINEGSVLRQSRNTFLFKNSQVQFHPNRIGDPYLQIAMVEANSGEDKQPIYFTGYVSEFSQNLGGQDMTSFLLTIVLGRVTSLVSFEIQITDSLTESSFITWVSRRLTDKVVVRYAIPLNDQEPLLEVKVGPFARNFLNVAEKENQYVTSVRHAQRFGFLQKPQKTIKRVTLKGDALPKSIRKKYKLERGDVYSETRLRYANFDLKRRLKRLGYLFPKIDTAYQDRVLIVNVTAGQKWTMNIKGLEVSQEEKDQLFLEMQGNSETSARHLELLMEKLAVQKGHPSAAAFAEFGENVINVDVYVGFAVENIQLEFGEAQALLAPLYPTEEERKRFLTKYFLSESSALAELRARLAALGYARPIIEKGDFPDPETFQVPIELGPKAILFMVIVNGEPVDDLPQVGQPFEYEFIAETVKTLAESKSGKKYQVRLTPRRDGQDIFFDVVKIELEDREIEELTVNGTGRLSEKTILNFLHFKGPMPQSKLLKEQKKLIDTGLFTLARLRTSGNTGLLEVNERNRWDIDYELAYDDVNEFGFGVQFRDRMMFKGFNPVGLAVRRNRVREEFVARQQFLHMFGTPIDFFVGASWNNERLDLEPDQSEPLFGTVFVTRRPRETTKLNAGLSYRLFEHQLLTAGITWEQIVTRQFEEVFFFDENNVLVPDPTIPPARLADLKVNRVPIRTSWLFSNLDNEIYPNNGSFAQVSYEYFPRGLGTNDVLSGWRALSKFNYFFSRGRWRWWQRLEAGVYQRELNTTSVLEDEADTNLFFLGGPKSIRGIGYQLAGPLRESGNGRVLAQGGQAMTIFTQEINYDLNLYGLGLSPFVDGGWVWRDREDFLSSDLLITGGLGLTLETPIGRFRIDWAQPLNDKPLDQMLNSIFGSNQEAKARGRSQILDEFSIRFGRVF